MGKQPCIFHSLNTSTWISNRSSDLPCLNKSWFFPPTTFIPPVGFPPLGQPCHHSPSWPLILTCCIPISNPQRWNLHNKIIILISSTSMANMLISAMIISHLDCCSSLPTVLSASTCVPLPCLHLYSTEDSLTNTNQIISFPCTKTYKSSLITLNRVQNPYHRLQDSTPSVPLPSPWPQGPSLSPFPYCSGHTDLLTLPWTCQPPSSFQDFILFPLFGICCPYISGDLLPHFLQASATILPNKKGITTKIPCLCPTVLPKPAWFFFLGFSTTWHVYFLSVSTCFHY